MGNIHRDIKWPWAAVWGRGLAPVVLFALSIEITREVISGDGPAIALDQWVLSHVSWFHCAFLTAAMAFITNLGSRIVVWATTGILAIVLLFKKKYASAVFLMAVVTGAWFLEGFLKDAIQRQRPFILGVTAMGHARGWSYPSAHATLSVALYGAMAYLGAGFLASRAWKKALWGCALGLAVLIALSRVYLQVHHPSDVVAGLAIGLLWLMLCIAVAGHVAKRWSVKR